MCQCPCSGTALAMTKPCVHSCPCTTGSLCIQETILNAGAVVSIFVSVSPWGSVLLGNL